MFFSSVFSVFDECLHCCCGCQSHDRLQVYGGHSDMVMCMVIHKSMVSIKDHRTLYPVSLFPLTHFIYNACCVKNILFADL